jgi:hypothetical protein
MTELYFPARRLRSIPTCSCLIGGHVAETASRCHGRVAYPLISVVIPTRNRAELVVATVLDQHPSDIEVLVVDDGSTDSTEQALASIADQRLRVVVESQGGPCRARTADAPRTDWLVFLDDDDHVSDDWLDVLGQAGADPDVEPERVASQLLGCIAWRARPRPGRYQPAHDAPGRARPTF